MKKRRLPLNDENTLLVVTSFPENDHEALPLAIHAKRSLIELSKKQNILVLAEKLGKKITHSENKSLLVQRVWKRNKPLSLLSVLGPVAKFSKIRNVLIQFDFDVYGGITPTYILPFIVIMMRFLGKHVYFEFQHAPQEFATLQRHKFLTYKLEIKQARFVIRKFWNFARIIAMNFYIKFFYKIIGLLCDKVIVFEEELRDKLRQHINADKLVTIPVGVTEQPTLSKSRAKRKLGLSSDDFVVLVFGFFDWHKGTDWITKVFSEINTQNMKLLLVGGKNPALKDNEAYQSYCKEVTKLARESSRTTIVGFVNEHKLVKYYSAADVVALPYREFMAAPSTLTHALGFHKPVIFSTTFIDYMKSPDFLQAMDQAQIIDRDLFFSIDKSDVSDMLKLLRSDKQQYNKLATFSRLLARKRRSTQLTRDYQTLVSKSYALSPRFAFSK